MKTKTYKYLYKPFKSLKLSTDVANTLDKMRITNVFICDKTLVTKGNPMLLYIQVHLNNYFETRILKIMKSKYYRTHYLIGENKSEVIILMEYPDELSYIWDKFVVGSYSLMYGRNSPIKFNNNKDSFKYIYRDDQRSLDILTKDRKFFDTEILSLFSNDTISAEKERQLFNQEWDSKINLQNETFFPKRYKLIEHG